MARWLSKAFDGYDRTSLRRDAWVCIAAVAATILFALWFSAD